MIKGWISAVFLLFALTLCAQQQSQEPPKVPTAAPVMKVDQPRAESPAAPAAETEHHAGMKCGMHQETGAGASCCSGKKSAKKCQRHKKGSAARCAAKKESD